VGSVVTVLRDATDRARAERAAERASRLQAISAALSEAGSLAEASRAVLEQVMAALGAAGGTVYLLDRGGRMLRLVEAVGFTPAQKAAFERVPLSAPFPVPEAMRTGQPLWLETPEDVSERFPGLAAYRRSEGGALVAVPLEVNGGWAGWGCCSPSRARWTRTRARSAWRRRASALRRWTGRGPTRCCG
jgi:GAF domain-containing protein